jgi:hypothetical protein
MNRTRLGAVLLLLGSLGAAQNTTGGAAEIEQLQVKRDGGDVTIQVVLTGAVKPAVETAINPDRLVLVLPGTLSDAKQKHFPLDANGVKAVRLGLNSANPPVTRVVIDLDSSHPYTLNTEGNVITLRVQPSENAEVVVRRFGPAPAASAPLAGMFRHKPQAPATDSATAAPAPIPVPPKFPPINFPEKQAPAQTAIATPAPSANPSAAHPKLGSLQQGTVFPGMGTPGAGSVPAAQAAAAPSAPPSPELAIKTVPTSSAPVTSAPATMSVNVAPAPNAGPKITTGPAAADEPTVGSKNPAVAATVVANTATPAASPASIAPVSSTPSSAGSPNITAKVLSATVSAPAATTPATTAANPPGPATPSTASSIAAATTAPASQGATVSNPLGLPPVSSSTATAPATISQGATVANPLGTSTTATAKSSATTSASTPQDATVANPQGTPEAATAATIVPPPVPTISGASIANPLGLAPGEKLEMVPIEPEPSEPEASVQSGPDVPLIEESAPDSIVAAATEPDIPTALALRAAHPDFRTAFKVKYVAAGTAYIDGGRSAGLSEGMKLVVRDTPTGAVHGAADGNADHIIAELEVTSVAEASAVSDVHTPKRDLKPGDLAYLSSQDVQGMVAQSTLSATRKYPTVISFTEGDTLDEEARVQVPRPPMPSVNRARGRIGVDYMGTSFHGSTAGSNTNIGLVARLDMTRIGGTYWNASGYWRGRLTANNYTGNATIQDLLNRTYHLSMTYDNPNSPWVAGFGRMYLPWATSLGRRVGHAATMGVFAGSTPDPTSWSYSPDRRIGGVFVNFEGGSYDSLRYTSTSGMALSTLKWKVDRPFVFFENGIYYKRYVAIYDSMQADSPVGYKAGGSPGAGISRNFLTVRYQPHERIEFDANYTYFRDLPTFNEALVSTSLLDKYLFQGFSGGVRLGVLKTVWVYTNLGKSNRSGDTSASLNELYGLTFDRLPWIHVRADGHYARFNSSFGNGTYESISLSRSMGDNFRLELLGGQQNFVSPLSSNSNSKFVTSNVEMNMGLHYFIQGGFTVSRGLTQSYDQWLFSIGYRFDSRRGKAQ